MNKVNAPQAEAKEVRVLKDDVKEIAVLGDGKRENTANELREAGHVTPNDRRIAMAAKGGPEPKDIVPQKAIPITKDTDLEAKAVEVVEKEDAEKDGAADTAKVASAKTRLASK